MFVRKPRAILPLIAGTLIFCSLGTMAQSDNAAQPQTTQSQNTQAQQSGIDRDVQMLRQDLRSKKKYAVIKQYADEWGNMNDEQALSLTNRALAVEQKVTDLRMKYVPIFSKVVPGTTVATFFQIERRVQAMVDLQLSAQLPLVQAQ